MNAFDPSVLSTPVGPRPTFVRLVRSEGIKLFTLRSTWWALGICVAANVAIAVLVMMFLVDTGGRVDPVGVILGAAVLTMLVAGVLGAIAVTGEYSTGMIRSTLAAEPRRARVVLAKVVILAAAIAVTTVIGYVFAMAIAAVAGPGAVSWTDPRSSVLPLAGGVFAMVMYALIGMGFGLIVRNSAGAIAVTVGVLFVLPVFVSLFDVGGAAWHWVTALGALLPVAAAAQLTSLGDADRIGPVIVLLCWAVGLLAVGTAILRVRDA